MTTAALYPEVVAAHHGRRALAWLVPLTVLWTALDYWQPAFQASGVPITAFRAMVHVLIGLGLWLALERTAMTPVQRRTVWLAVMIPYTLWLAVIWSAAINGAFRPSGGPPLLPIAILLPVIVVAPVLLRSARVGQALDAMPDNWLVGFQVYRLIGNVFLAGWALGVLPGIFALPAGIGDVTTGLLALPTAIWLMTRTAGARRAAIAWNVFGLADFAIAVSIAVMIAPGPLQMIVPSVPIVGGGLYPGVMIPAFGVPSSILLHVLSLRQLIRRGRAA